MITANNLSKYLLKQLKSNCPVDTGNLQNNGIFESQSSKTSATILVGTKAARTQNIQKQGATNRGGKKNRKRNLK